jgi:hypothetical protein
VSEQSQNSPDSPADGIPAAGPVVPAAPGRRCKYPTDCRRAPKARVGDRGREPEYCEQADPGGPVHTRQAARAEQVRRDAREAAVLARAGLPVDSPEAAAEQVPVDWARASVGALVGRLEEMAAEQAHVWDGVLNRLATATSSDVAQAQLRAGSTAARAEVATAQAAAASAEQTAQAALARAEAADAAAEAAHSQAAAAETARAQAETTAAAAAQDADQARAELADQVAATGEQALRAETAEADAEQLRQQLARATSERDALAGRLTDTLATLADTRETARADAAAAAAREHAAADQITRLDTDLTTARAQVEQLHTDIRAADAATAAATARAERGEADAARQTATANDLTTQRDKARTDNLALRDQLADARTAAATAVAREQAVGEQMARLTDDLHSTRTRIDQLQVELAKVRAQARKSDQ